MSKYKKIINDPGLFFRDFFLKRYPLISHKNNSSIEEENTFSNETCFFKYGHIKCAVDGPGGRFQIKIGSEVVSVAAIPGKWFTNVPILLGDNFELLEGDASKISLEKTDKKVFHPDQLAFDVKYNLRSHQLEGESVYYSLMGNVENPRNILVTFSGVSNFDNVNYRLSALTSVQGRLGRNTLIIAFQDREGVYGNYMYKTSSGYPIKAIVISLIGGLVSKFKINESKLIFYGNSKGGSVVVDYIKDFKKSHFFIDIPQMDLFNYKSQNDLMRYSIGVPARKYYNFLSYLPSVRNPRVSYSFAENDYDASRGLVASVFSGINVNMLKDMGHSNSAMELVKRQFSKIIQIVNNSSPVVRPLMKSNFVIEKDKLYFKRVLGAFKEKKEQGRIYAEINFLNDSGNYSISLNKIISDAGVLVCWRKGFDFKKHLSSGVYKLTMTVYHEYREFVYPLDKRLIVDEVSALADIEV